MSTIIKLLNSYTFPSQWCLTEDALEDNEELWEKANWHSNELTGWEPMSKVKSFHPAASLPTKHIAAKGALPLVLETENH